MKRLASARTRTILETADTVRECGQYRQIILECHPRHAVVRAKGLRTGYPITYEAIYSAAVKITLEAIARERKAAKKAKAKR